MVNWNRVTYAWQWFARTMRKWFGRTSDDDLTAIAGNRDRLIRKFRELYGITQDEAEGLVRDWEKEQKF